MIRFVLQKIKNKKWLTTCLLLGLVFLVAAVSCQPMFKAGLAQQDAAGQLS